MSAPGKPIDFITVGVVTAPQGLRGAVRVRPLTDFPERFQALERVFLLQGPHRRPAAVEWAREHARGLFAFKFQGVDDREGAEGLRGAEIQVPRDEVHPLPEGAFYVFELLGLAVETVEGERVGEVVDVITTAANDVYVVRDGQGRETLIPAVKQVVVEIDPSAGRIVIDPLPGLLE